MLADAANNPGRRQGSREPLRVFGKTEEGAEIKLMEGRFGPYVTDGTTNATLPKGTEADQLSLEDVQRLIAEKVAKGPAKPRKKAPAAKKAPAKKAPAKKAPAKKATAKKPAAKKPTAAGSEDE